MRTTGGRRIGLVGVEAAMMSVPPALGTRPLPRILAPPFCPAPLSNVAATELRWAWRLFDPGTKTVSQSGRRRGEKNSSSFLFIHRVVATRRPTLQDGG